MPVLSPGHLNPRPSSKPKTDPQAKKHTSWKAFLVEKRVIFDVDDIPIKYQVPPSWRLELQLWDLLENAFRQRPSLEEVFADDVLVLEFVALALQISVSEVESRLDSEAIESTFLDVWKHIAPTPEELQDVEGQVAEIEKLDKDLFTHAIAMFAVECGWFPNQVLDLPKIQVSTLGTSVSNYLADKMKFQATIHGARMDGDSAPEEGDLIKLDDETALRGLQLDGLPIEIR